MSAPIEQPQPPMPSEAMEEKAIAHVVSFLTGMRARYAILLPNGHVYGDLPIAQPPRDGDGNGRKAKQYRYSPGTFMRVYEPYLKDLKVGEVARVPFGEFPPDSVRSAMSAYACNKWGKQSGMTNIVKDQGIVELMRMR